MPILTSVAVALVSAGVPGSMLAYRRYKGWSDGRAVKDALLPYLDRLIAQAEKRDPPFESLSYHGSPEEDGAVRSRSYFIHFEDRPHLHVSMRRPYFLKSGAWIYAVDFKHPALIDDRLPSLGGVCRSPWFVERMEKLFRLLDAYPPEDLLRARREREYEALEAEWDQLDKEADEILAEYPETEADEPEKPEKEEEPCGS